MENGTVRRTVVEETYNTKKKKKKNNSNKINRKNSYFPLTHGLVQWLSVVEEKKLTLTEEQHNDYCTGYKSDPETAFVNVFV